LISHPRRRVRRYRDRYRRYRSLDPALRLSSLAAPRATNDADLLQFSGDYWASFFIAPPAGSTSEDRSMWFAAASILVFTLVSCVISFGLAFIVYMVAEKPVLNLRLA
jgi:hypothetical protein